MIQSDLHDVKVDSNFIDSMQLSIHGHENRFDENR